MHVEVTGLALETDHIVLSFNPSNYTEIHPYSEEGVRNAYHAIRGRQSSFVLMEEISSFHRHFAAFYLEAGLPVGLLSSRGRKSCPTPFGRGIGIGKRAANTLSHLACEFLSDRIDLDLVDPEYLGAYFGKPLNRPASWETGPDKVCEKAVSEKYGFIWIGVPKVATRSLLDVFIRRPQHPFEAIQANDPLPLLLDRYPETANLFAFTFVRNPWSRVVSTYLDKMVDPNDPTRKMPHHQYPGLFPGIQFDQFVEFLLKSPYGRDEYADRHWLSQHKFFEVEPGRFHPVTVGHLETFERDLNTIANKIGIEKLNAPHHNSTSLKGGNSNSEQKPKDYYTYFYTDRTRRMIADRYARDIEMFGYEFSTGENG